MEMIPRSSLIYKTLATVSHTGHLLIASADLTTAPCGEQICTYFSWAIIMNPCTLPGTCCVNKICCTLTTACLENTAFEWPKAIDLPYYTYIYIYILRASQGITKVSRIYHLGTYISTKFGANKSIKKQGSAWYWKV